MLSNEIVVSKKLLIGTVFLLLAISAIGAFAGGSFKSSEGASGSSGPSTVPPNGPGTSSPPAANLTSPSGSPAPSAGSAPQDIYIHAKADGSYDKSQIVVNWGALVRLHFTADPNAGCGRQFVVYGLNVKAISRSGEEQVVEFTPTTAGTYDYSCGMRMWGPGKLVVQ